MTEMNLGDFLAADQHPEKYVTPFPWMEECQMVLVTEETLDAIIDKCIESKYCALDVETTGLDNRVFNGRTVDSIVGFCLAPDEKTGYYIPIRHRAGAEHNISITRVEDAIRRLCAGTICVFHNSKFDQEFLEFNGGDPIGDWDRVKTWEDTLILYYLFNSRAKAKGLKFLSKHELGCEMFELKDLFPKGWAKKHGGYDYADLDPSDIGPLYYGCSDGICTIRLFHQFYKPVVDPPEGNSQARCYMIEKANVPATRQMQRNRMLIDRDKVKELVGVCNKAILHHMESIYSTVEKLLGRDVRPGYYKWLLDPKNFNPETGDPLTEWKKEAKLLSKKKNPDPTAKIKDDKRNKEWSPVYDLFAPAQLGMMFDECGVPGLTLTEKSGQIKTAKDELDRVIANAGKRFPWMKDVSQFRQNCTAMSNYLVPMTTGVPDDGWIRIQFNGHKVDTGRFSTPTRDKNRPIVVGWPKFNLQSVPATYNDPEHPKPESMLRLRECFVAPPGYFLVAIDFSGEELRIVTNLSREPIWIQAFFQCIDCGKEWDKGPPEDWPPPPPPDKCPECGGKTGDLHSVTGDALFPGKRGNVPEETWKALRNDSKCVHPDTLLAHAGGPLRIGELRVGEEPGSFQKAGGMKIWTGSGWNTLSETYNGGVKPLFHVVSRRGILTCSENHRFLLEDGQQLSIKDGLELGQVLAHAENPTWPNWLGPNDVGGLPFDCNPRVPTTEIPITPELAYFCGLYLGDGTKHGVQSVGFSHGHVAKNDLLGVPYQTWQDHLMAACIDVGFSPTRRKKSVYLGSQVVMRYLEALGLIKGDHRNLRIPDWVLRGPRQNALHLLGGLFDTDGTVTQGGMLSVTTKSAIFAGQIAALLNFLGTTPRIEPSFNKTYKRWYYRIALRASEAVSFKDYIHHPGKKDRLRGAQKREKLWENTVKQIIPAGDLPCVDVSLTDEPHLYWSNGLITHNTVNFQLCYGGGGSTVSKTLRVPIQEGWRIARQFQGTYHGLGNWWETQRAFGRKFGYVRTPFGRRYPVPDINLPVLKEGGKDKNAFWRSKAERNAINGPVQATGGDIIKIAMVKVYKILKKRGWEDDVRMIITMHDELVFMIRGELLDEAIPVLAKGMVDNGEIRKKKWPIPFTYDAEIGLDWTVPWDYTKLKRTGKWPDELKPYFQAEDPDKGGGDEGEGEGGGEGEGKGEGESAPPSPESKPAEAKAANGTNGASSKFPTLVQDGVFTFQLTALRTVGTASKLAGVIHKTRDSGTRLLRIKDAGGVLLEGWEDFCNGGKPVYVNDQMFYMYAQEEKL